MEFGIGVSRKHECSIGMFIEFQQRDQQNSQNLNNDTFCRLPVTSCQCIIGTKIHPESCILLNYDDDYYFQAYGHYKEASRAITQVLFFNHIYLIMISDLQMLGLTFSVIIYMFLIKDISKTLQLPNQSK